MTGWGANCCGSRNAACATETRIKRRARRELGCVATGVGSSNLPRIVVIPLCPHLTANNRPTQRSSANWNRANSLSTPPLVVVPTSQRRPRTLKC